MRNYLIAALLSSSFLASASKPANGFNGPFVKAVFQALEEPVTQKPSASSVCTDKAKLLSTFDDVILPFCAGAFAVAFVPFIVYHDVLPYLRRLHGAMNPIPGLPFVPPVALRNTFKHGG